MTEADTIRSMSDIADGKRMFGRTKIMLDYDTIDSGNILEALGRAVAIHNKNAAEIEYLWRYYCGDQPVLNRTKAVRPEINNKIVVNVANEIVSFKVGYQVGEPVQYVSRTTTTEAMNSVMKLNEFMFSEDKAAQDQEVVEWQTIGGTAYTVNWVIADCDYWWHKGDQNNGMETHHVVIVPQAPIFSTNMNATNTTEGGYKGSRMYRETIPACATGIVNAFGSGHILKFRDGISNRVDTGAVSSGVTQWTGASGWWGEWADAYCNLMSEKMVYGAPITASGAMDNTVALRQMSAFRLSERLINYNRNNWWLRDVVSSALFAYVSGAGLANASYASAVRGVRPFALLV